MAIQAQLYATNAFSPFCNNGYSAAGLIDSHFNSHQQQQSEQHLRELYNGSQAPVDDPNLGVNDSKPFNSSIFAGQIEKQCVEIDQYIRFQNEELRYTLQEHGKQQLGALVKRLESYSVDILKVKDEEIAQTAKKRIELEEYLNNLEAENRKWRRVAREKETMALTLYKTLEEMREGVYYSNYKVVANDAESFCDENRENEGMEEEAMNENEENKRGVMLCKSCHSRTSCFLFLPCRHLSSCKVCNAFLEACPVCRMPKKATIETLIF
ncbi:hypothetical protein VNO77_36011 [Canavalia gladiata]|uniref:RING-type domain-containing protein n=1 Tax=Canavalia gladiata TaxID=3824 RepID=A0AAN9PVF8_CANGL